MPESKRQTAVVAIELQLPNGGALGPEEIAMIDMIRKERSIIGREPRARRVLPQMLAYRRCAQPLLRIAGRRDLSRPARRRVEITQFGERLVALYRSIERHAAVSSRTSLEELNASLDWAFDPKARVAAAERDLA